MDLVEKALAAVPRANFIPEDLRGHAHVDSAMPIGHGQTISQPSTVEMMLRWVEAEPGNKVLDLGSGSGWTAALLSKIVGAKGKVYAVELVPELVEFGKENCRRLGIKNATFYRAGETLGLPKFAPFDRILVSASANKLPKKLLEQLVPGGKMVIPIRHDILEIEKSKGSSYEKTAHPGFVFVPLIDG